MITLNLSIRRLTVMLVVLMAATSLGSAQSISTMATCGDDEMPAKLKASPVRVPMVSHPGDVNCDASVDISDVTGLIDLLLSGSSYYSSGVDVNGDGSVDISDLTALIDMLLNGSTSYNYGKGLYDLNEVYKSMRTAGWSTTGNWHHAFGISAFNLAAELMGDDMIMSKQGSGWFWHDASYNVKTRYTSNSWRSYDLWNAHYTWIANANYILEAAKSMTGTTSEQNYIKGQAYAIRAYSYFMLAQWFARTYKGHESDPGVPIFEGLVFNGSTGQPRATVAQVYAQIDADINQAISLLNGTTQLVPDHIGYAVALGLKARIAMVKEDWATAYSSASSAISASGKTIQPVDEFLGVNDAHAGNVMWGADIPLDEALVYTSFFAHMSTDVSYGQTAPKQITPWLYNKMSETDTRRAWWDPESGYSTGGYVQKKFDFSDLATGEGDFIWMRVEEMYLIVAEAACRRGQTTTARNNLNNLMAKRDPNYTCNKSGRALGNLTTDETGSLLEEILIQRRLELWGEDSRIMTIRRLRQGFERTEENGWPSALRLSSRSLQDSESYPWVMTIPLSEFLYNANMNFNVDQNPIGDYPEDGNVATGPQNISFSQAEYYLTAVGPSCTENIQLTRSTTEGNYQCLVIVNNARGISLRSNVATFSDGSRYAYIPVGGNSLELGKTYSCELTLSPADIANGTSSGRITSTRVEIKCENAAPAGQHISFESASQKFTSQSDYGYFNVTLTRRVANGDYRATVSMEDAPENMHLYNNAVVFKDGELTAQLEIYCEDIEIFGSYSCVLRLSDADIATAIPGQPQNTSTVVTINGLLGDGWNDAGTCTFTDYTWEDGYSATNVPILKQEGTNKYCIVSPLSHVYPDSYSNSQSVDANWFFYLNDDGSSISPEEGMSLNYWGYRAYYDGTYPDYCYVTQDGNTYDVHFLLTNSGNLYQGGRFVFTWNR